MRGHACRCGLQPDQTNKRAQLFQFFALIPGLTAFENVELPLLLNGKKASNRRERVFELLEAVGLNERASHRPDQMSGGEQQRVAIARALATHPLLVLADEPTANLDSKSTETLLDIMEEINREEKITFIFSTHDKMVMDYARRLVLLRDGRISDDNAKD